MTAFINFHSAVVQVAKDDHLRGSDKERLGAETCKLELEYSVGFLDGLKLNYT